MRSMDKNNKNLSQFSDLNEYMQNDTSVVPNSNNASIGLVKPSKRYIDESKDMTKYLS